MENDFYSDLQQQLDVRKWLDSEENQMDMCGNYEYCTFCDKSDPEPCASAFLRKEQFDAEAQAQAVKETYEADTEEVAEVAADAAELTKSVDEDSEITTSLGKNFDLEKVMQKKKERKSLSFAEKYALSDEIVKERYAILKQALTTTPKGAPKIKSRISRQCDTYRRGGDIVAKITIIASSLRINLPLDCDAPEFNDGTMPHVNMGHKKAYEEVPFQFKVNSKLALKRALRLIELIK